MTADPLRRRLREYLTSWFKSLRRERGLSSHTLASYKNVWQLLVRFGVIQRKMPPSNDWRLVQIDREFVLLFLEHVERDRRCAVTTRNHRLAAVKSFFVWLRCLEPSLQWHCDRILGIPEKRAPKPVIDYLEHDELRALLLSIDTQRPDGVRDLALLCLAYNTGARVHELANLRQTGLKLVSGSPTVRLWGKGRKQRQLPLWNSSADLLRKYIDGHRRTPADEIAKPYVFLNHRGHRMTRWGIAAIIERAIAGAATRCPTLGGKRLTAHSMRHTTAVHLLQSGVDLVTIQNWLGHSSPDSVNAYLGLDLKSRRDLLERCLDIDSILPKRDDHWVDDL